MVPSPAFVALPTIFSHKLTLCVRLQNDLVPSETLMWLMVRQKHEKGVQISESHWKILFFPQVSLYRSEHRSFYRKLPSYIINYAAFDN